MGVVGPVDWQSQDTHLLLSHRLPERERRWLATAKLPELAAHVWLASSGTSSFSEVKLVALSKQAFLNSAAAVNTHIDSNSKDVWFNILPTFHVGGLSVFARAHLSGARVVFRAAFDWSADNFCGLLQDNCATLTSLVPTQVYDLVAKGCQAPSSLRAVIVGGGAIGEELYKKARKLGWPLLPSYGLSECCSQVATAGLDSLENEKFPQAKLLDHIEAKVEDSEGPLWLKSQALLTGYARVSEVGCEYIDPKVEGWFKTEDLASIQGEYLSVLGRVNNAVKVGGELVNLHRLNQVLQQVLLRQNRPGLAYIISTPSDRLGHQVDLVVEDSISGCANQVVEGFNDLVFPFERIRQVHRVDHLPRTDLGKVQTARLLAELGF